MAVICFGDCSAGGHDRRCRASGWLAPRARNAAPARGGVHFIRQGRRASAEGLFQEVCR